MDSTLSYFDLAINALPWTPYRRSQITKARALTGNLCFDELLSLADIGQCVCVVQTDRQQP